eukprot:724823-Amphidinium_carterae.2
MHERATYMALSEIRNQSYDTSALGQSLTMLQARRHDSPQVATITQTTHNEVIVVPKVSGVMLTRVKRMQV